MSRPYRSAWKKLSFAVVGAAISLAGQAAHGAAVLTDTFGTSTLNAASPGAPTATSTNYAVLSSKDASATSMGAGSLNLTMPSTTSGLAEVQALFTSTPLTLAATGDFVQFTAVFAATNINSAAGNSTVNIGLYNSHGTTPVTGGTFTNTGLVDPGAGQAGFAVGWEGYVARFGVAGNNFTISRPAQLDTTNESQDLLFSNAATGAFDNPSGTATTSNTSTNAAALANGTYTLTFKLTRTAANALTVENHLYSGVGTGGTELQNRVGTAASPLTFSFDGLAIGYREVITGANAMNFSLFQVDTNLPIPEPTGLALLGFGAIGMLARRRRRRAN